MATILTNDLSHVSTVKVDNVENEVTVSIYLDSQLEDSEKPEIYIKYKTALKGLEPDYGDFVNTNVVTINGADEITASETIEFVQP